MVYSSLLYIYGFLPISLLLYYLTPKKWREITILLLSMIFCGMISLYFLIFITVYTVINFICLKLINRFQKNEMLASVPLLFGIIFDLVSLLAFRTEYFTWLHKLIKAPEGFYPVGISFFALSAIGTLIDEYKNRLSCKCSLLRFSIYIMFFPKLIMGPLLRYGSFTKLLDGRKSSLSSIGVGMNIFVKGLAKKIIIADNLYMLYRSVQSSNFEEISAVTAWLGITAYIFCLYFTLSGIADMGTGIAYCFGIRLPQSFNYPLLSSRIKYFSARWQSQVVQWLRRYITKPLYNSCEKKWLREVVSILGWAIFGFWYTFDINGLVFGTLVGTFIIIEAKLREKKIMELTGVFYTFLIVIICSVFLSGSSISYSFRYILIMIGGNANIADSQAFYLIKSYIVLILLAMYASTDLFRNMMTRSGKKKLKIALNIMSPIMVTVLLIICTALLSYSGSSEMLLIKL
ncbi:MBOAT family O-acyltransferase [Ruminococcus sp.]|uniref:MBOAT family O-acyltransferase n=1 Tax=Ruminococcus sp. TaxID=41978 RepID=UPI0025FC51D0|nr:MBOAT family O-acyltransferase [Ruminococcus sp.]